MGEQALDFDDVANQLLEQGADQSPAHLHGAISGVLAGAGARDPDYCLAAVSQALELDIHGELADSCLRLAELSLNTMADEELDFHPFLPDDEVEIEQRVQALADWCSGLLSGYALAVVEPATGGLGEEIAEVLKDVTAIAEATVDAEIDAEESENQFFELTEYLRFAARSLFMDAMADDRDATDAGVHSEGSSGDNSSSEGQDP